MKSQFEQLDFAHELQTLTDILNETAGELERTGNPSLIKKYTAVLAAMKELTERYMED